jgi:MFS family permease
MFIVALSPDYAPTLLGAAINGVGSGMVLPTLIGWAMTGRPLGMIGRAAGTWNSVYALGQFMSPPLFLAIAGLTGAFASSMFVFAVGLGIAALAAVAVGTAQQPAIRARLQVRQGS